MRLEGRSALVTGGASGIGAATVRRLAAEGARVAVADLDPDRARDVSGEIDGHPIEMDVTDNASIVAGVAATVEAVGPLDVLVNNAGGGSRAPAFFVHTDEEEWTDGLRLNLWSVLAVTHAVLPAMQERGSGAIVNIASEAGPGGLPLMDPSSGSKAGRGRIADGPARGGAILSGRA